MRHEVVEALVRFGGSSARSAHRPAARRRYGREAGRSHRAWAVSATRAPRLRSSNCSASTTSAASGCRSPALWPGSATEEPFEPLLQRLGDPDAGCSAGRDRRAQLDRSSGDERTDLSRCSTIPIRSRANRRFESPATSATATASDTGVRPLPGCRRGGSRRGGRAPPVFRRPAGARHCRRRARRPTRRECRAAAANALGAIMEAPASRLLAQALDDADSWVRYFAAMGLGRHGDASSLRRARRTRVRRPGHARLGRGH